MKKIKLNIKKIQAEKNRLGKTWEEIARELGVTRQALWYALFRQSHFELVNKLAQIFHIDPKDLII